MTTAAGGITAGTVDFTALAMQQLGHVMGFESGVDGVDAGTKTVQMTPLDMFRLAPGQARELYNCRAAADDRRQPGVL